MLKRSSALAAAGLLTMAAAACAPADDDDADPGQEAALDVVAAFYPLEFVTERVGGEHVAVTGLAPPGVEAHDLELTPSQVGEVSDADLVVYLTDFQPAVDAAVDEHAGDSFDVASVVPLLDAAGRDDHGHDDDHHEDDHHEDDHHEDDHHEDDHDDHDHDHGHDDEHGHEDEDEHGHEEDEEDDDDHDHAHDHGDEDPHVWLDPTRLATIADELAAELGALDSDNADDYTANAQTLRAALTELDTEYEEGLADCERREIVVSHAAFGYLADRYDLRQIAITGLSPEDEPTPQRMQEVIDEAEAVGATTIFFEVLVAPDVAETIARETGTETAVLDPVEGLAPGSEEDYLSIMRQNLDALQTALGCR